jgi:hypothetical protein
VTTRCKCCETLHRSPNEPVPPANSCPLAVSPAPCKMTRRIVQLPRASKWTSLQRTREARKNIGKKEEERSLRTLVNSFLLYSPLKKHSVVVNKYYKWYKFPNLLMYMFYLSLAQCNQAIINSFRSYWTRERASPSEESKLGVAICLSYFRRLLAIDADPAFSTAGEIHRQREVHHQYIVQLRVSHALSLLYIASLLCISCIYIPDIQYIRYLL